MSGAVWAAGIGAAGRASAGPAEQRVDDARLRRACAELESVFLNELLKLMRESVPESGLVSGGTGEEIFTTLLDQHIAVQAAERMERGLGAALYRHFRAATAAAARVPERGAEG
ncbi:MAG TPA: rod-binding protein [Longimicrobiales bacterium]